MTAFGETLAQAYPWFKALHIIFVIAWMAGLLYLPRLYAYHVDSRERGKDTDRLFQLMERRLLKMIMSPAMAGTWLAGLLLLSIPGAIDWESWWPWIKAVSVVAMTWFHFWLARKRKELESGRCRTTARQFRRMNEMPTALIILIVVMVVVKPF